MIKEGRIQFTSNSVQSFCFKNKSLPIFLEIISLSPEVFESNKISLLDCCSVSGSLEIVKYIDEQLKLNNNENNNDDESISTTKRESKVNYGIPSKVALVAASRIGNLEIIKYLATNRKDCIGNSFVYNDIMESAVEGGHFSIVQYLIDNKLIDNITDSHVFLSISNGNFQIFKFLVESEDYYLSKDIMLKAIAHGRLEFVDYLYNNKFESAYVDDKSFELACYTGNLEIIDFLFQSYHLTIDNPNIIDTVSRSSNNALEVLNYLDKNGFKECKITAFICAIDREKLDIFKWLIEHHKAVFTSISNGERYVMCQRSLVILKFAVDEGDLIDINNLNHLDCIKNAISDSYDIETFDYISRKFGTKLRSLLPLILSYQNYRFTRNFYESFKDKLDIDGVPVIDAQSFLNSVNQIENGFFKSRMLNMLGIEDE